ncbi:FAD-dependent oxidoreductase [Temperatibacter marinus]|uniref:FAD-dependent oxidoreductase n=1 Tax=Temperatibacter marinus TaxID=1456591 RepID=A0AA52EFQ5_9PROT|nr:FAD-dependent oxidoreductase [Temperatibacter marinus]WND03885.1 FAD-dependent oxidoreductase [Temperatibacter marinus]
MSSYPTLFSPMKMAGMTLKNRLGHASMTTRFCKDGVLTENFINYHHSRAKGGTGLIVTEPLALLERHEADPRRPTVFSQAGLEALARLAAAVEGEDTRLLGQIQEFGRGRHEVGRGSNAVGASALPDDLSWTVPHPMSEQEILAMIETFADSTLKLKNCGFSGVEISAGHGHIFHQFLSPQANKRDDSFGGDTRRRCQMIISLIDAIRERCGNHFILGLKLPGEDYVPGGIDMTEAFNIAKEIGDHGHFDYWTFAWGAHANSLYTHLPDAHGDRAPYNGKIAEIRKAAPSIPTGALGYMTDPNEAEHALTSGQAELAFFGRPLVTDPAFGNKAREGREGTIRYCVSCNTCWRTIVDGNKLECDNNPLVGQPGEDDWTPSAAEISKKVVIVGGGISGLEAAWVAAARGHVVTLFSASQEVGGKTRLHAELPGGENLSSIYDYQYEAAVKQGVTFKLGTEATAEDIKALEPDVVLLATGSTPSIPNFIPEEYAAEGFIIDLRLFSEMFLDRSRSEAGTLLIYDQDHTDMTYAAAEYFSSVFDHLVLATPRERIGSDMALVNRQGFYQRLHDKKIEIITSVEPEFLDRLEDGIVRLKNVYNGSMVDVENIAAITFSTARVPNNDLLGPLRDAGIDVKLLGDAFAPRSPLAATREGFSIAMTL